MLRERLGNPPTDGETVGRDAGEDNAQDGPINPAVCGIEILVKRVVRVGIRDGDSTQKTVHALLGLDPAVNSTWPSQAEVAEALGLSRGRIGQIVGKLATRWAKDPAVGFLRTTVVELLDSSGGIQSVEELAEAILSSRGSSDDEPMRTRGARAVARAAVEVERTMSEPRFIVRRDSARVLIARSAELVPMLRGSARKLIVLPDRARWFLPRGCSRNCARCRCRRVRWLSAIRGWCGRRRRPGSLRLCRAGRSCIRGGCRRFGRSSFRTAVSIGVPLLSVAQIRERVESRYPEAEKVPDRPVLDELLVEAGVELHWDSSAKDGAGGYVNRYQNRISVSSQSDWNTRHATAIGKDAPTEMTPEEADAGSLRNV